MSLSRCEFRVPVLGGEEWDIQGRLPGEALRLDKSGAQVGQNQPGKEKSGEGG